MLGRAVSKARGEMDAGWMQVPEGAYSTHKISLTSS